MKVLIADDSKILQERLYGLIEECEFVTGIEQAFNTIDAKDIIQKKKIDIVISDIRMPGGGGFDLLEYIRIYHKGIKVILITNYPYPQYSAKAKELGAEYFLSKSDELEELIPVIEKIHSAKINS